MRLPLVDETNEVEIQPLINKIDALGRKKTGYFALFPKLSSAKDLSPLKEFMQYLALTKNITFESQREAEIKLANLSWNLSHANGPRKAERVADSAEMIVTEKDYNLFYESQQVCHARKLLAQTPDLSCVTKRDYTSVRDYLITDCILKNLLRPCSLYAVKLEQFESAQVDAESGLCEVPLFYDKTVAGTQKPVYLHMSDDEFRDIQTFIKHFRNHLMIRITD